MKRIVGYVLGLLFFTSITTFALSEKSVFGSWPEEMKKIEAEVKTEKEQTVPDESKIAALQNKKGKIQETIEKILQTEIAKLEKKLSRLEKKRESAEKHNSSSVKKIDADIKEIKEKIDKLQEESGISSDLGDNIKDKDSGKPGKDAKKDISKVEKTEEKVFGE